MVRAISKICLLALAGVSTGQLAPPTGDGGPEVDPSIAFADSVLEWKYPTGQNVGGEPVLIGDDIYVGSLDNRVHKLNREDGKAHWIWSGSRGGFPGNPGVSPDGAHVFVGGTDGNVYALKTENGLSNEERLVWKYPTGGEIYSSAVVNPEGTHVFIGSDDGHLHAITIATGTAAWTYDTGGMVRAIPVLDSGNVIIASLSGHMLKLRQADGGEVWAGGDCGNTNTSIAVGPLMHDGMLIWPQYDTIGDSSLNQVVAVKAEDCSPVWSKPINSRCLPTTSTDGNTIYIGDEDKYMHALNKADGTEKWKYYTLGVVRGPATENEEGTMVFFGSNDEFLHAVHADTGKMKWMYSAGYKITGKPSIWKDIVYTGGIDSKIYYYRKGSLKYQGVSDNRQCWGCMVVGLHDLPTLEAGASSFGMWPALFATVVALLSSRA